MRIDRRLPAVLALIAVAVLGLVLEARPPAWVHLDPILQPFGQGIPPDTTGVAARKARERTPLPVLLSRASEAELVALPGIGPKTAARILAWRDTVGTVESLERLEEVRGIGPAKREALAPWLLLEADGDTVRATAVDSMR